MPLDQLTDHRSLWRVRPSDERFDDIAAAVHGLKLRRENSVEIDAQLGDVKVYEAGGALNIFVDGKECQPTHWAFAQLCGQVGPPTAPATYLRSLPTWLAAQNLAWGFDENRHSNRRLLVREVDGARLLLSVTTLGYGRIWDVEIAEAVQDMLPRIPSGFAQPTVVQGGKRVPAGISSSDRDLHLLFVDQGAPIYNLDNVTLRRGFMIWNSEVGGRSCGLSTFLFHEQSGGMLFHPSDREAEFSFRHSKNAARRFADEMVPKLERFSGAVYGAVENEIALARGYTLPRDENDLAKWFRSNGFSVAEAKGAIEQANKDGMPMNTLWDAIAALTAHNVRHPNIDSRIDAARRTGVLLKLALL